MAKMCPYFNNEIVHYINTRQIGKQRKLKYCVCEIIFQQTRRFGPRALLREYNVQLKPPRRRESRHRVQNAAFQQSRRILNKAYINKIRLKLKN